MLPPLRGAVNADRSATEGTLRSVAAHPTTGCPSRAAPRAPAHAIREPPTVSFLRDLLDRRRRSSAGDDAPDLAACGSPRREPGIVGDDVPRSFAEPVAVVDLETLPAEHLDDGRIRVTFWANLRDAEGGRCPDVAVDARIEGPEHTGEGTAWTDAFGQVRFRTSGPAGTYRCVITGAGAGALDVRRGPDGVIAAVETEAG